MTAEKKPSDNVQGNYGPLMTLGFQLAAGLIAFVLLGYFLDQKTGGGVKFTVLGMILAFAYGGYEIWKTLQNINDRNK